jgi:protein phosphatase PTC7
MAEAAQAAPVAELNPMEVMDIGYNNLIDEEKIRAGASTACVGVYRRNGQFNAAKYHSPYLPPFPKPADMLIVQPGRLRLRDPPQRQSALLLPTTDPRIISAPPAPISPRADTPNQSFNCPLQLAVVPNHRRRQVLTDLPRDSAQTVHDLQEGDVVIFATDGVWDNLTNQQILRLVSELMLGASAWESHDGSGIKPSSSLPRAVSERAIHEAIAKAVVAAAKSASTNAKVDGPFAKDVQRLFPGEVYRGGKVDDICVVATVVVKDSQAPEER